jgi:alpha-galactosidase
MKTTLRGFALAFSAIVLLSWLSAAAPAQSSGLVPTPPMGWNGWEAFGCKVDEQLVKAEADAIVSSGMQKAGYLYVNLDDCWEGTRDSNGNIQPNSKFPDMPGLVKYVHNDGLKFGIYSSPGPKTCAGYLGSYKHEQQDATTYAGWGVDYLKYDWCSAGSVYKSSQMKAAYDKMYQALQNTSRPIVYSLCQYGLQNVWQWGAGVGGNLWRTGGDVKDNYDEMWVSGIDEYGLQSYAGPGQWNDPDLLQVGNGGMTADEYRSQMALWSLLAAPLLASTDLTNMTQQTLAILTNPDVIAVDQDSAGIQGSRYQQTGPFEIWTKSLTSGSTAVGLFNRSEGASNMCVNFRGIGVGETAWVRDLWAREDRGSFQTQYCANVPKHGVVLVTLN